MGNCMKLPKTLRNGVKSSLVKTSWSYVTVDTGSLSPKISPNAGGDDYILCWGGISNPNTQCMKYLLKCTKYI